ncbi:hypothetical protein D3C76_1579700 [compost metagenome]
MTNEVPKKMEVGFTTQKAEFTPAQLKRLGKYALRRSLLAGLRRPLIFSYPRTSLCTTCTM